jgi:hypothetical protein
MTRRPPHGVYQPGVQGTECVLVQHEPVVKLDDKAAFGKPVHRFRKMRAGLAEDLGVKQAIDPPVQHVVAGIRGTRREAG